MIFFFLILLRERKIPNPEIVESRKVKFGIDISSSLTGRNQNGGRKRLLVFFFDGEQSITLHVFLSVAVNCKGCLFRHYKLV